jgi:hypothetical protein
MLAVGCSDSETASCPSCGASTGGDTGGSNQGANRGDGGRGGTSGAGDIGGAGRGAAGSGGLGGGTAGSGGTGGSPSNDGGPDSSAGGGSGGTPADGGTNPPVVKDCGDGTCASTESCSTCAMDCAPCGTSICRPQATNCVTVNDTTPHQTMRGWEATAQAGQATPQFTNYGNTLFDRAVNELGISRLRVEVRSPSADADFDLGPVDSQISEVVLPMRAALAARGESLWVNVCVVGSELKNNPTKYAAQALRTVQHIQTTYRFVPDSWEVALEPDVFGWNDPALVGAALVAAGKLLAQNGYDLDFVAPSTTQAVHAPQYVDVMEDIPDIFDHWRELSYHRYDYPDVAALQAIAAKAQQHGLRTSMIEHIDSGHADLFADLTEANVSVWQQYTLAFPAGSDNGAQYFWPQNNGATLSLANRARYLRQYFAYVRDGAVRVGATSTRATLKPTAFITANNRYVVVMNTASNLSIDVAGLPAGTYGITYTTAAETHVAAPDVTVGTGGSLTAAIPGSGVVTVFGK